MSHQPGHTTKALKADHRHHNPPGDPLSRSLKGWARLVATDAGHDLHDVARRWLAQKGGTA